MLFGNPKEAGDISLHLTKKNELSCRKLVRETVVYDDLFDSFSGNQPMLQSNFVLAKRGRGVVLDFDWARVVVLQNTQRL